LGFVWVLGLHENSSEFSVQKFSSFRKFLVPEKSSRIIPSLNDGDFSEDRLNPRGP